MANRPQTNSCTLNDGGIPYSQLAKQSDWYGVWFQSRDSPYLGSQVILAWSLIHSNLKFDCQLLPPLSVKSRMLLTIESASLKQERNKGTAASSVNCS